MGRRKKPLELKQKQGTLEKSREPKKPIIPKKVKYPSPIPTEISTEAKKIWRKIGAEIGEYGYLSNLDTEVFKSYVLVIEQKNIAIRDLKTRGYILSSVNKEGHVYEYKNLYAGILKDAMDKEIKFSALLGLSPSDRSKIDLSTRETEEEGEFFS